MKFTELEVKKEYRSLVDNMSKDFYEPLLKESISYKRAVGFFTSTVLVEISKGISGLIKNGGSIKLITSPNLNDEDIKAIYEGYASKDEVVKKALLRELQEPQNSHIANRLNYLANLIASGKLDIRIAVTKKNNKIGIYHEKVGILEDVKGNKIAFSGSMNETANALLSNYETIDVFMSWNGDSDRINTKETSFDRIWDKIDDNISTYEIQDLNEEIIKKYRTQIINCEDYVEELDDNAVKEHSFFRVPSDVSFYDYQKKAISNWFDRGCFGVYDMATGTGKTYTALGSLAKLSESLNEKLAVIIVVPYIHLVEQWIEDIEKFNVHPIKAYGYAGNNWRQEFKDAVNAYNLGVSKNFCIITTNATFANDDFQNIITKFKRKYCFVADEAHNLGAEKLSGLLPLRASYRLALSATLERHMDDEGTASLYAYFGKKACISFGLDEAIKNGFLTPYYYHPVVVYLNSEELNTYNDLTGKIIAAKFSNKSKDSKTSYVELLRIKRARVVAGCREKIDVLIQMLAKMKEQNNILVYCGATKYDRQDINDESEIEQIVEITSKIGKELGMKVRKFTSKENNAKRAEIKRLFVNHDIQVITAIKCLDEGVNIPAINTAFILASSTNPKEYIQRRGRVLRKAENKEYAVIYDFITLPRHLDEVCYLDKNEKKQDLSLIKREIERMKEFGQYSLNPSEIDCLQYNINDIYEL